MSAIDKGKHIQQKVDDDILTAKLKELQKHDVVKPAYVPFATLGAEMLSRVSKEKLAGNVLVMSDLGLLVSALRARKGRAATGKVTFLCHVREHADWATSLKSKHDVNVTLVEYDRLAMFFAGEEGYNFGGMKFDVIVGNPPFQPEIEKGEGKGNGSGNKIWQKFIEQSFELAKDDGHLLFVTPHNWRTGNFKPRAQHRKAQHLIFDNDVQWWIDARSPTDYFPTIGNSNSVDAWHAVKGRKGELPEILKQLCLLPKSSNPETLRTVSKFYEVCMREESIEWHGCDSSGRAKGDLEARKAGDAEHKYRVANTSAQVRKGLFHWSDDKRSTHDLRKVLVCASGQHVIGYDNGTMAIGRQTGAYVVGDEHEGQRLVEFLQSDFVKFIATQFMKEGAIGFPMELFERLPKALLVKPWQEVFGEVK